MHSITLEGPPFERGYQHGKTYADEIMESIRIYNVERWLTSSDAKEIERKLLHSLADSAPELVIEMIGISKGSGITLDLITLLNLVLATNDLSTGSFSNTFKVACTAIGFGQSDFGPLVAKNCDEADIAAPFYLFQTVYPEEGMSFMGISWVGTVWLEGGLNSAGLGLMQTAGPLVPRQDGTGIVCNIAPRLVLSRCKNVRQGVAMFREMRVAGWGMGAVLADADGRIVVIEKTYDLMAESPIWQGVGFCTNHFLDPIMKDTIPTEHLGLDENSRRRYQTLTSLFKEKSWPHTQQGMKNILAYHGEAGFVCQHGDANMHTNYSCIACPRQKMILLGDGYPCLNRFQEYRL